MVPASFVLYATLMLKLYQYTRSGMYTAHNFKSKPIHMRIY